MTTLLIDVGNSRLKWAWVYAGRLGRQRALSDASAQSLRGALRLWRNTVKQRMQPLQGVFVVSVADARFNAALARRCRAALGVPVRFLRCERSAGGVRNGYRDVWRLGADRWAALLGAHAVVPRRAVCIVDIGTAMTIDLLDATGRHRGGAIVPGPALMQQALLRDTRGIRHRAGGSRPPGAGLFARDTRSGLIAGSRYAVAALVDRAYREAAIKLGVPPLLLLTGGAADDIAPLLQRRARLAPDLVLRGLAALVT